MDRHGSVLMMAPTPTREGALTRPRRAFSSRRYRDCRIRLPTVQQCKLGESS
jgi:hypothetical protein